MFNFHPSSLIKFSSLVINIVSFSDAKRTNNAIASCFMLPKKSRHHAASGGTPDFKN